MRSALWCIAVDRAFSTCLFVLLLTGQQSVVIMLLFVLLLTGQQSVVVMLLFVLSLTGQQSVVIMLLFVLLLTGQQSVVIMLLFVVDRLTELSSIPSSGKKCHSTIASCRRLEPQRATKCRTKKGEWMCASLLHRGRLWTTACLQWLQSSLRLANDNVVAIATWILMYCVFCLGKLSGQCVGTVLHFLCFECCRIFCVWLSGSEWMLTYPIHKCACEGDSEGVRMALEGGHQVDEKDDSEWTALHYACWWVADNTASNSGCTQLRHCPH